MKPAVKKRSMVAAAAVVVIAVAVILAGTVLPDNPVKQLFKEQSALNAAKMHMAQVKSGVYTGSLRFSDDIDFDHLALSQPIPMYGIRENGELFRYENDTYAVFSNEDVVAAFGVYKAGLGSSTSMSNVGLGVMQALLEDPGTCAIVLPWGFSDDAFVAPGLQEAVIAYGPAGPTAYGESPLPLRDPESRPMEELGITSDMISHIDFPKHRDPIPFSV